MMTMVPPIATGVSSGRVLFAVDSFDPGYSEHPIFPVYSRSDIPTLYDLYTIGASNIQRISTELLSKDYLDAAALSTPATPVEWVSGHDSGWVADTFTLTENITVFNSDGISSDIGIRSRDLTVFYPSAVTGDTIPTALKTEFFKEVESRYTLVLGGRFVKYIDRDGVTRQYMMYGNSFKIYPEALACSINRNKIRDVGVVVILVGYQTMFFARELLSYLEPHIKSKSHIIYSRDICSLIDIKKVMGDSKTGLFRMSQNEDWSCTAADELTISKYTEYLARDELNMRKRVYSEIFPAPSTPEFPSVHGYPGCRIHHTVKEYDTAFGAPTEQNARLRILYESLRWSMVFGVLRGSAGGSS